MSYIVVTGAAGCIGSALVRHLNDAGIVELVLVDDAQRADKWENLAGKRWATLLPKEQLFKWLQGRQGEIRAFVHLGACTDTLQTNWDLLMENNYRYSVRLAEYALTHGHRFIYASSAATYGSGSSGFCDDHAMLEDLQPLNPYAYSKHLVDVWLKREGVLDCVVGLKYFNVFGPNENHKGHMASMLYKMFPVAYQGGAVQLFRSGDPSRFADGQQCRDFIYVKDAVRMTAAFLTSSHAGIYNIGRGEPTTWTKLTHSLFHALDREPRIEYVEMPQEMGCQYQNYTCADMTKYTQAFGASGQHSIDEAVKDYVQNHLLIGQRW